MKRAIFWGKNIENFEQYQWSMGMRTDRAKIKGITNNKVQMETIKIFLCWIAHTQPPLGTDSCARKIQFYEAIFGERPKQLKRIGWICWEWMCRSARSANALGTSQADALSLIISRCFWWIHSPLFWDAFFWTMFLMKIKLYIIYLHWKFYAN